MHYSHNCLNHHLLKRSHLLKCKKKDNSASFYSLYKLLPSSHQISQWLLLSPPSIIINQYHHLVVLRHFSAAQHISWSQTFWGLQKVNQYLTHISNCLIHFHLSSGVYNNLLSLTHTCLKHPSIPMCPLDCKLYSFIILSYSVHIEFQIYTLCLFFMTSPNLHCFPVACIYGPSCTIFLSTIHLHGTTCSSQQLPFTDE